MLLLQVILYALMCACSSQFQLAPMDSVGGGMSAVTVTPTPPPPDSVGGGMKAPKDTSTSVKTLDSVGGGM